MAKHRLSELQKQILKFMNYISGLPERPVEDIYFHTLEEDSKFDDYYTYLVATSRKKRTYVKCSLLRRRIMRDFYNINPKVIPNKILVSICRSLVNLEDKNLIKILTYKSYFGKNYSNQIFAAKLTAKGSRIAVVIAKK